MAVKRAYRDENDNPLMVSYNEDRPTGAVGTSNATTAAPKEAPKSESKAGYSPTYDLPDYDYYDELPEWNYTRSSRVNEYENKLKNLEASKPAEYQSQYKGQIDTILDGILNQKSFDINTDPNYRNLYDLYSQQYQANASRQMRDVMGSAAGMTGGYGSTYAQNAASQAYDNTMQGLNDRNINLMNLAYQMYGDERANRYNQLGAVQGVDNTDYGRYRDTVGDYYNDLNYHANRYNNEYARDYGEYMDSLNQGNNAVTFGKSVYDSSLNQSNNQIANRIAQDQYADSLAMQEDQTAYNRYQDALSMALQMASSGYAVPEYVTNAISDYTGVSPQELASQLAGYTAQAQAASASRGGGGGGGSSSASGIDGKTRAEIKSAVQGKKSAAKAAEYLYSVVDEGMMSEDEAKSLFILSGWPANQWAYKPKDTMNSFNNAVFDRIVSNPLGVDQASPLAGWTTNAKLNSIVDTDDPGIFKGMSDKQLMDYLMDQGYSSAEVAYIMNILRPDKKVR